MGLAAYHDVYLVRCQARVTLNLQGGPSGRFDAPPIGNNVSVIHMSSNGACSVMAISGEFDLANEPQFNDAAKSALASGCREFIVDLDGVTYLDGRALAALMSFFKSVSATGGYVRIVTANPFHRRLFSITGIDRVIGLFSTREEAEAAESADDRKKA